MEIRYPLGVICNRPSERNKNKKKIAAKICANPTFTAKVTAPGGLENR